jgi:N-dimethylarginine dimethylaminohydrolase
MWLPTGTVDATIPVQRKVRKDLEEHVSEFLNSATEVVHITSTFIPLKEHSLMTRPKCDQSSETMYLASHMSRISITMAE